MIDALETLIRLISTNSGTTSVIAGRVASRHRFGSGSTSNAWPTPSKAIQLAYDTGGGMDLYSAVQEPRLNAHCYGEDEYQAALTYNTLVTLTRESSRVLVNTSQGTAFVYWFLIDSSPQTLRDTDIQPPIDYIQVYLTARVAEVPTSS
jgi:hypothetical protein